MRKFLHFCLLLFLMALPIGLRAQQGNNWAFGLFGGLSFNTNPPTSFVSSVFMPLKFPAPYKLYFANSTSAISDCEGKLLFYSTGMFTWNRNHKLMPNGHFSRFDTSKSTWNTCYIMPHPRDTAKYYIFTGCNLSSKNGMWIYARTIDMRLDGGLGDVIPQRDTLILSVPTNLVAITKQANDTDYWFLTIPNADTLYAYPVTQSGIGKPVISKLKFIEFWPTGGLLKCSHNGKKIVVSNCTSTGGYTSYPNAAVLFDFDNVTGLVSNPAPLYDLKRSGYKYMNGFGLEFSANDSFLYLNTFNVKILPKTFSDIVQYCTFVPNPDTTERLVFRSTVIVSSGIHPLYQCLQIGPDSKIYTYPLGVDTLGVIPFPEKRAPFCKYFSKILSLPAGTKFGLTGPSLYFRIHKIAFNNNLPTNGCRDTIHFTNTSDTTYFRHFRWYFGDGDSSDLREPKHIYRYSGKYLVTIAAYNQCGHRTWYTDSIRIQRLAHAGFKEDTLLYACGKATLKLHSIMTDTFQKFYFGDSTAWHTSRIQTHYYTKAGSYAIMHVAGNGWCTDTARLRLPINIEAYPKADFNISGGIGCKPFLLNLSNLSTNNVTNTWKFDDGGKDTGIAPGHIIVDTGLYAIKLIVVNRQGCIDSLYKPGFVKVIGHSVPLFSLLADTSCGKVAIDFQNKASNYVSLLWDFGDGKTSSATSSKVSHIYTFTGVYDLKLKSDNGYCSDSISKSIAINLQLPPKAGVVLPLGKHCLPFTLKPLNTSSNSYAYIWDFGDKGTDSIASPTHAYKDTGVFSIRLISFNKQGCTDTSLYKNAIQLLKPPVANMILTYNVGCGRTKLSFTNTSTGFTKCKLDFGDGFNLNSFTGTVSHFYTKSGNFTAKVIADNGLCLDSLTQNVTILVLPPPKISFGASPKSGIAPLKVQFNNLTTGAAVYAWDFGYGKTDTANNPLHIYKDTGYYSVWLWADNKQGCKDSVLLKNYIYASPAPASAFSFKDSSYCGKVRVVFNNQSKYTTKYTWDFGDGNLDSTSISPVYYFTKSGRYRLRLKSANKYGFDTSGAWITVKVPPAPKSGFSLNATQGCSPAKFTSTNKASGAISKLVWHLYTPTGKDSIVNPVFTLSKGGDYVLKQWVQDSAGCKDSSETKIHTADQPKAGFSIASPIKSCEKLSYSLTNISTHLKSCIWNLGDGTFDKSIHPSHTYSKNGSYVITLKVQNEFCMDSQTQILNVNIRPRVDATFQLTPMVLCFGRSIAVLPKIANADSISWQMGNGTGANNKTDFNYNYSKPGKYLILLKAFSAEGCVDSLMQPVNVLDTFRANMLLNTTKGCSPLFMKAKALTKAKDIPLKYTWTWGDDNQSNDTAALHTYQSKQAKKFSLKLKVSNGYCADSISSTVKILAFRPDTDMVHIRQVNSQQDGIYLNWLGLEEASYFIEKSRDKEPFNFLKISKDTFISDERTEPGKYTYTYRITSLDKCGNKSTVSAPARSILLNGKINPEEEALLHWSALLSPAEKYILSKDSLAMPEILDTSFTDMEFFTKYRNQRCYQVRAFPQDTLKGYTAKSNIQCYSISPRILIPNAFSPNGDGLNDTFNITANGIKTWHLQIYDRWGARIFETFDKNKGWDGSNAPIGAYLYILEAIDLKDKPYYFKGTLMPLK